MGGSFLLPGLRGEGRRPLECTSPPAKRRKGSGERKLVPASSLNLTDSVKTTATGKTDVVVLPPASVTASLATSESGASLPSILPHATASSGVRRVSDHTLQLQLLEPASNLVHPASIILQ